MIRLPRATGQDVIKALFRIGFTIVRQRGSHVFLQHTDGRTTVVPVHTGEIIGPGLLSKILRDTKISREEFRKLLN